jgi:hypothetical protein
MADPGSMRRVLPHATVSSAKKAAGIPYELFALSCLNRAAPLLRWCTCSDVNRKSSEGKVEKYGHEDKLIFFGVDEKSETRRDEARHTFEIWRYAISRIIQSRLDGTALIRLSMCSVFLPLNTAPIQRDSVMERRTCARYSDGSLRAVEMSRFTSTEYCLQKVVPLNDSSINLSGCVSTPLAGESGARLVPSSGMKNSLPLESSIDPLLSTASRKLFNLWKKALFVNAPTWS